jgi:RNA polymerase sigma factor (TIGR02999 family)
MAGSDGTRAAGASPGEVTALLRRWQTGQHDALDDLLSLVYRELKALARTQLKRERSGHTLQPTALVHEAFLRLVDQRRVDWRDRGHFYAIAAQAMRRVLVDHARRRLAQKRGAGPDLVALGPGLDVSVPEPVRLLALDDALCALAALDPRQAGIVELRYFGGLSVEDIASALGVSAATVKREWASARLWLQRELRRDQLHDA